MANAGAMRRHTNPSPAAAPPIGRNSKASNPNDPAGLDRLVDGQPAECGHGGERGRLKQRRVHAAGDASIFDAMA